MADKFALPEEELLERQIALEEVETEEDWGKDEDEEEEDKDEEDDEEDEEEEEESDDGETIE